MNTTKIVIGALFVAMIAIGASIVAASELTDEDNENDLSPETAEGQMNGTAAENVTQPEQPTPNGTEPDIHHHHHGMRPKHHRGNASCPGIPPVGNHSGPPTSSDGNFTRPVPDDRSRPYRDPLEDRDFGDIQGLLENLTKSLAEMNWTTTCPNCGTQLNQTREGSGWIIIWFPKGILIIPGQ